MASETFSKIYGHPRFGLIVGMFLASIVLLLVAAVAFFHFHTFKPAQAHRTGMVILLNR